MHIFVHIACTRCMCTFLWACYPPTFHIITWNFFHLYWVFFPLPLGSLLFLFCPIFFLPWNSAAFDFLFLHLRQAWYLFSSSPLPLPHWISLSALLYSQRWWSMRWGWIFSVCPLPSVSWVVVKICTRTSGALRFCFYFYTYCSFFSDSVFCPLFLCFLFILVLVILSPFLSSHYLIPAHRFFSPVPYTKLAYLFEPVHQLSLALRFRMCAYGSSMYIRYDT